MMNREDSDGYVHAYYVPSIKDPKAFGLHVCMQKNVMLEISFQLLDQEL